VFCNLLPFTVTFATCCRGNPHERLAVLYVFRMNPIGYINSKAEEAKNVSLCQISVTNMCEISSNTSANDNLYSYFFTKYRLYTDWTVPGSKRGGGAIFSTPVKRGRGAHRTSLSQLRPVFDSSKVMWDLRCTHFH
jgi:hypothetical protein